MAHKPEEMPLFRRADAFVRAVIALLDRPELRRNRKLWDQIAEANDSVISNFVEGFEQRSDMSFANYVGYSKASLAELIKRLRQAERRRAITVDELTPLETEADELARMMGGFIKYLRRSNFRNRGTHLSSLKGGAGSGGSR